MASQLRRFAKIAALPTCIGSYYVYHKTKQSQTTNLIKQSEPIETPVSLPKLPEKIDYLLVGGGTASHSAMRAIRCHDPTAKVLIISKENQSPYTRPALSKELWFTEKDLRRDLKYIWWNNKERSIYFEIDEFYLPLEVLENRETGGVSLIKNTSVTKLDPDERIAFLDNGQSIKYEKCLLAPGGKPNTIPAFDAAPASLKDKIIYYRTADDFLRLEKLCEEPKRVVIVGGGFLGSELACALSRRSEGDKDQKTEQKIIQIFPEPGNLAKILPEYLSQYMTKKIENEGCKVISNVEVKSVTGTKDNTLLLKLSNGDEIQADYAVCAVGIEPDVKLAKASGLEVDDRTGGFLVNSELEARTNVWVAGDASCFYDIKLGRRRVEHHDHAVKSGGLAGRNMVGDGKAYTHQPMFWSDIGQDVSFEAVGLIDSNIETVSVFTEEPNGDLAKGVVFYLKDEIIVGILLWNLFGRINIARRILDHQKKYDDLNEVAKLFNMYTDDNL